MKRIRLVSMVLVYLALAIAGCSDQSVQVSLVKPVENKSAQAEKYLVLSNCGNLNDVYRSLAEQAQVVQTIQISDTATRIDRGETIQLSDSLKTQLIAVVKQTYQADLDEASEKVNQTNLMIPGQRIRHFTISWKQQVYRSEISFGVANQRYKTTYTCTLEIPEASQSAELICTG